MTRKTTENPAQTGKRRRTRAAIVAATADLLARGATPSVGDVAAAADVSRRTIYMYFPTLEQLTIDATLLAIARDTVDEAVATPDADQDVAARVERMARSIQKMSATTERHGRALMRLTAEASSGNQPSNSPPRGYRRVEWIERALEPLRPQLDSARFQRLVTALAMVVGWEALIVQRDIRALDLQQAEDVSAWAARALVAATINEMRAAKRARNATSTARSTSSSRSKQTRKKRS